MIIYLLIKKYEFIDYQTTIIDFIDEEVQIIIFNILKCKKY